MRRVKEQDRAGGGRRICRMTLRLLVALTATCFAVSAWGEPSDRPPFALPYLQLEVGEGPSAVVLADLNGDGELDIAVANQFSNTVSVLLGRGAGAFDAKRDYAAGGGPYALAVEDLNGDGTPDLAVANSGGNSVGVFRGQGDGTFAAATEFATGAEPVSVAIADLNEDSKPDLVAVNDKDNSVSILLADDSGGYRPKVDAGVGLFPRSVAVGDVDADGHVDLAVANTNSSTISVMLGHGDGTFATHVDYSTRPEPAYPTFPSAVAIADVTGDGPLDLVVANLYGPFGTVSVLRGLGEGTFASATYGEIAFNYAASVTVADLDADGRLDAVTADPTAGTVVVARFDSWGSALFGAAYSAGSGVTAVAIGDVNRDGRPDLVAASQNARTIAVLLTNEQGGFRGQYAVGRNAATAAMGDLDRDRVPDLAVVATAGDSVWTFRGRGDGSFGGRTSFATGVDTRVIEIADVNGDAMLDLVTLNSYYTTSVSVLLGRGDGTFANHMDLAAGQFIASFSIADVNADRLPDLILVNNYANSISVMLNAGNGTFSSRRDFFVPETFYPTSVVAGDLDGDGHADLVVGGAGVLVLPGFGDGSFGTGTVEAGAWVASEALADLNRDGRLDLVAGTYPDSVLVALGDGRGGFDSRTRIQVGQAPQVVLVDLNDDGQLDLLAANYWGTSVSVLRGYADGSFLPWQNIEVGSNPRSPAIADLDGDEKPDLVVLVNGNATVLINQIPRQHTPALLSMLEGRWERETIELRWGFGDPGEIAWIKIERADAPVGPWIVAEGERHSEGTTEILTDRGVELGRTYYYRLEAGFLAGGVATFGPLEVAAAPSHDRPPSITVAPSPCTGLARIEFAVVRDTPVRMSVLDVQGRLVAKLADGVFVRGRHQVSWDGRDPRGPVAAGVYFVRYEALGTTVVRRLILSR